MDRPESSGSSGTVASKDGISLFYRQYPVENERARVLIVHGLCEHSGRYGHIIDLFNNRGIAVWAYDHRGHGQSKGKRGHIESFSDYVDDLNLMHKKALSTKPEGTPMFLLGHSMGGLIVLNYSEESPDGIDGIIVSSPGLAPADKIPAFLRISVQLLSSVAPAYPLDNQLEPEHLSHDTNVVDNYIQDPLVHRKITSRWVTRYSAAMANTFDHASSIKIPILMQVAGDDRIVDPDTSRKFFEHISSSDKKLHFYDGLYHEIYNETDADRQRVFTDLENWLDDHIPNS